MLVGLGGRQMKGERKMGEHSSPSLLFEGLGDRPDLMKETLDKRIKPKQKSGQRNESYRIAKQILVQQSNAFHYDGRNRG